MDWLNDLQRREERLKRLIAGFGRTRHRGADVRLSPGDPDSRFRRHIQPEVEQISALLEDYLCGRDEDERSRMSYEVRLNLPLFSHLHNLYTSPSASEKR